MTFSLTTFSKIGNKM